MAFGDHIIGTYAIDENQKIFPLMTYSASPIDKMHGFPAAFLPIQEPLEWSISGDQVFYFFCLAYHKKNYGANLHIYAKSMVYAYKALIENTNILHAGQVRFFVDTRCLDIVMPYLLATNLQSLVIPFESEMPVNYAAYIPCFFHKAAEPFKYKVYTDLDMWWANMSEKSPLDLCQIVNQWDEQPDNFYGQRVFKTAEQSYNDLYERYLENDQQRRQLRQLMYELFQSETLENSLGISGTRMVIRDSNEANTLKRYYENYSNLLRDDEAFWAVFFTDTKYEVGEITAYLPAGDVTEETRLKWLEGSLLFNVGSYHFDHFHHERYSGFGKLYDHFKH